MSGQTTVRIQACLDRVAAGDITAQNDLLQHASRRLDHLARRIFADFPKLKRWVDCEDALQDACLRLTRALAAETPASPRDFFRLAALQIRRQLLDLARHYYGPHGAGTNHPFGEGQCPEPSLTDRSSLDPAHLAEWTEWQRALASLPDDEREVFDLLWYYGLTQPEAAGVLNVSLRTVKRRWQRTRLALQERFSDTDKQRLSGDGT
jgi:RNA polymerase sigma-70 factor (ECF subfamily)